MGVPEKRIHLNHLFFALIQSKINLFLKQWEEFKLTENIMLYLIFAIKLTINNEVYQNVYTHIHTLEIIILSGCLLKDHTLPTFYDNILNYYIQIG